MGYFLLVSGIVALGFLIYSLVNRERLEISVTHPRILIEFGFSVAFLAAGSIWFRNL
jgi:hypothetical protein